MRQAIKTAIVMLLALCLLAGMIACGDKDGKPTVTTEKPVVTEAPTKAVTEAPTSEPTAGVTEAPTSEPVAPTEGMVSGEDTDGAAWGDWSNASKPNA